MCQKQNPSSSRFCCYVQHGKSGRPLVISLELQQCRDGVREIVPFTTDTAVLLMGSCIHILQEKSITESAMWGSKHLAWGLCSCEPQTRSIITTHEDISRFSQNGHTAGIYLIMKLLQSWWYCLICSGFPLSLCWIKPKSIVLWTGAIVCRSMVEKQVRERSPWVYSHCF